MAASLSAGASVQELHKVMAEDEYDTALAPALEAHVIAGIYDKRVVQGLFRLYQAYPTMMIREVVVTALLQALMALPSTDLLTLSYLLPSSLVDQDAQVKKIMEAADLLETGRFSEVWALVDQEPFTTAPSLKEELRRFILSNISQTCRSLPHAAFCELLGIDETQLDAFVATSAGLASVQGPCVVFVENSDNGPRPKQLAEALRYEEIVRVIEALHS